MFWGSFSSSGIGSQMSLKSWRLVDSDKYNDVNERKVIPDMRRAFLDCGDIFQQDSDPVSFVWKSEDKFQETQIKSVRIV